MITIPKKLLKRLESDSAWDSYVKALAIKLDNILNGQPVFFREYTFHGVKHVNRLLELIGRLIPTATLKKLTGKDIGILISSVLLHDIGMFIQNEGLQKLIYGKYNGTKTDDLDKMTWKELWEEYLDTVDRYSSQRLIEIFGTSEPIKAPPEDMSNLTDREYMVYGEFLRRQHHRLAHEITTGVFMGSNDVNLFEDIGIDKQERDLIGLIARSHGIELRETEAYLRKNYASVDKPNNVSVMFLMCVLRLADYLDAGEQRAPKENHDLQNQKSSISYREWRWNQAIKYDNFSWNNEKECLEISAYPEDNIIFIKVKSWLEALQAELDTCWAVISENYKNLKLSIHRIESNVTNPDSMQSFQKDFSTKEAKLKVNTDILKLLIQPLYGNDPSYGVRELIQNAVDSCRERKEIENRRGNAYEGKVHINIDTENKTFTITDNGIGMNENVILNYYLTAGSSYRYSENWMKDFIVDKKAKINRTGKFGVGVLSTFLIGEKAQVQTRHIDDSRGYEFSMSLEESEINLMRADRETGTTITIGLSDKNIEFFKDDRGIVYFGEVEWGDWYHFTEPEVKYFINGNEVYKIKVFVPDCKDGYDDWFALDSPDYKSYRWQYRKYFGEYRYCNGITIPKVYVSSFGAECGLSVPIPSFSIVDYDCNLEINLARSEILEIPDKSNLIMEIYKLYIAKLISLDWENTTEDLFTKGFDPFAESGYIYDIGKIKENSFIFLNHSYTVFQPALISKSGINEAMFVWYKEFHSHLLFDLITLSKINMPVCFAYTKNKRENWDTYNSIIKEHVFDHSMSYRGIYNADLIFNNFWSDVKDSEMIEQELDYYFRPGYYKKTIEHPYCRYSTSPSQCEAIIEKLNATPDIFPIIAEYAIKFENKLENNLFLKLIDEYLGDDIWIPFDMEERKKKFPKAFKELKKYML